MANPASAKASPPRQPLLRASATASSAYAIETSPGRIRDRASRRAAPCRPSGPAWPASTPGRAGRRVPEQARRRAGSTPRPGGSRPCGRRPVPSRSSVSAMPARSSSSSKISSASPCFDSASGAWPVFDLPVGDPIQGAGQQRRVAGRARQVERGAEFLHPPARSPEPSTRNPDRVGRGIRRRHPARARANSIARSWSARARSSAPSVS